MLCVLDPAYGQAGHEESFYLPQMSYAPCEADLLSGSTDNPSKFQR